MNETAQVVSLDATRKRWSAAVLHQRLADLILLQPDLSQGERAKLLGYTQSWVSTTENTDAFQHYLATRRTQVEAEIVKEATSFRARVRSMGAQAAAMLQERMDKGSVGNQTLKDLMAAALKQEGDEASRDAPNKVENHLHLHGDQLIALLRKTRAQELLNPGLPPVAVVATPPDSLQAVEAGTSLDS